VRARNAAGLSGPWSPSVAATPRSRPGTPHLTRLDPRDRSAMVRWAHPAEDGGSAIIGYTIHVLTPGGDVVKRTRRPDASAHRFLVRGLDNGGSYLVQVRARNEAGGSPWSESMKVRLPRG
jgi:hypothetical protein